MPADRDKTKWMHGFPPAKDKVVRFSDGTYYQWPQLRWTFSNIEQLVPTRPVWRGPRAASELVEALADLDDAPVLSTSGDQLSWNDALALSVTDAFGVLHQGRLVYENYSDVTTRHSSHVVQSCAKSFAGILAEMLIEQGTLNEEALIPNYLPEMAQTAWGDATLRQVMDMLVGMRFDENYANPNSEVWRYLRAGGMLPPVAGEPVEALCEYLKTIPKEGVHGSAFSYREPNINILTWIIQRVTDKLLNELLSEMIWQHIGAEHDARYMVDPNGFCTTASCTMRDFLKFGELVRTGGEDVISQKVRDRIFGGGDVEKFALFQHPTMKNWSYRSQWWIRHSPSGNCPVARGGNCAVARGAHGQFLYIDPANEIVIARFGSQQEAPGYIHDDIIFPMFDAITALVSG